VINSLQRLLRPVSPLHQGGDVGVRKAKQIEAAIVEVVLGEVGIGFG
jgi:hypothetical protein